MPGPFKDVYYVEKNIIGGGSMQIIFNVDVEYKVYKWGGRPESEVNKGGLVLRTYKNVIKVSLVSLVMFWSLLLLRISFSVCF